MEKIKFQTISHEKLRELERNAYNGILDFNAFPAAEYKYFDTVQDIGRRIRCEGYPTDFGRKDIDRARGEYDRDRAERLRNVEAERKYQQALKDSAALRCKINKTADVSEALTYALMCIELLTGEEGFAKRAEKGKGE